jgi:hypothetical protein
MVEDFARAGLAALREWPDIDLFLVPTAPFDAVRRDLEGVPAFRLAERLQRPVFLVQNDGAVDPLLSPRLTERRRSLDRGPERCMDLINSARVDEALLEAALDAVVSYPIQTPVGMLDRDGLRHLLSETRGEAAGAALSSRRLEMLDPTSALSLETWEVRGSDAPLRRWTRLVKLGDEWKISSIEEGLS